DQPREEGRDRIRPPGRALLDAVSRVLGTLSCGGAESPLAAELLRGDAPLRFAVRVPELHRSRPRHMETCVLRDESPPPRRRQAALRPEERLSLEPEHSSQA